MKCIQTLMRCFIHIVLLSVIFCQLLTVPPSYAGGFLAEPVITSINKIDETYSDLHFSFDSEVTGTAYCFVLAKNSPIIDASTFDPLTFDPGSVYAYHNFAVTPGSFNEVISLNMANLIADSSVYKLQVFIIEGITPHEMTNSLPVFYAGNGITQTSVIRAMDNGFLLQYTTDIPGKIYTKLFSEMDSINVSVTDLLSESPYEKASFTSDMPSGNTVRARLVNQQNVINHERYRAMSIFRDPFGVLHTAIQHITVDTPLNPLMSAHYDNGTLGSTTDDQIMLNFKNPLAPAYADCEIQLAFDSNAADFSTPDIIFYPSDFTKTLVDKKIILTLTSSGYEKIDTAAEFDNGAFQVIFIDGSVQTADLNPEDLGITYQIITAPLSQTLLQQPDEINTQLVNMVYDAGALPNDKSDDQIILTFTGADLGDNCGPLTALLLEADNDCMGRFVAPDVVFERGTDYDVNSLSGLTKQIEFLPSGIDKLNLLTSATLRVRLGTTFWDPITLDPSVSAVYVNRLNGNNYLSNLEFNVTTIADFDPEVSTCSVKSTSAMLNSVELASKVGVFANSDASVSMNLTSDGDAWANFNVTALDGTTRTYNLTILQDHAAMNALLVNGTLINGFSPTQHDYTVTLPSGVSDIPEVVPEFELEIAPGNITDLSSGTLPGTYLYRIEIDFETFQEYINVTFISAPVNLTGITVGGIPVADFDPEETYYDVSLPTGVYTMPAVVPTFTNPDINPNLNQGNVTAEVSGTLPGTIIYAMTIEKESYSKTITLNVSSTDITISNLTVGGQQISGFAPDTTVYNLIQPTGVITFPAIVPYFENADISTNDYTMTTSGSLPGTYIYTINIIKGSDSKTITINLYSPPIQFDSVLVDNVLIEGFNSSLSSYTINRPTGVMTLPEIAATVSNGDMQASDISVTSVGTFPGTAVYTITAAKGSISKTITVNAVSLPITLSNLLFNGAQITNFDPNTNAYTIVQGTGQTAEPVLSPVFTNYDISSADYSITRAGQLPGELTTTIAIEKGSLSRNIVVSVSSAPITLSNLLVNNATIQDFDPETLSYALTLPTGQPEPTILPVFSNADLLPTDIVLSTTGNYPGTKVYEWLVSKGTESLTLTLTLTSPPITLNDHTVNGSTIAGFSPEKTHYDLSWATGDTTVPELAASFVNSDMGMENVSVTHTGSLPGTVHYTIRIVKWSLEKTITVDLTGMPIQISGITANGLLLDGFSPELTNYNLQRPTGDTVLPNLSASFVNADMNSANVNVTTVGTLPGTAVCTIDIQKGSLSKQITVIIHSKAIEATAITVNQQPVPNVQPNQLTYTIVLESGLSTLPSVTVDFANTDIAASDIVRSHTGKFPGVIVYTLAVHKGSLSTYITLNLVSQAVKNDKEPIEQTAKPIPEIDLNKLIESLASSNEAEQTIALIEGLDRINALISDIDTEEALFSAISQLSNIQLKVKSRLQADSGQTSSIMAEITKMTQAIERKLTLIESPEDTLTSLKQYLDGLKNIKSATDLSVVDLDHSVEDMINRSVEQFGTTTFKAPDDPQAGLVINAQDVAQTINRQLNFVEDLKKLSSAFFDDSDTRSIKTKLTIAIEKPSTDNQISVTFTPSIMASIQENNFDSLAIEVAGTTISIPSRNIQNTGDLEVSMKFLPSDANNTQPRVNFTVYENDKLRDTFSSPLELKFNLSLFGFNGSDTGDLGIFKLDEATNTWIPVGGIVDPETGQIYVSRSSLSQYTVMKSKKSFTDADNSWAKVEINSMLSKGIIAESSSFKPQSLITRGEFASWIAKAYGLTASSDKVPFKDIKKSNPYYDAITAVFQMGLISGKDKSVFDPNGNITNEEMAVIIGKTIVMFDNKQASTKVKSKYLSNLKATKVANWAESDMALLMELGITKSDSLASANGYVTKETAAAAFMKFYRS